MPALVALLLLVAGFGRYAGARAALDAAARDAARAASLERSVPQARATAAEVARAAMAAEALGCSSTEVATDTAAWGPGGSVAVELTCTLRLSELALGLPGTTTVRARFVAPLDAYRGLR